MGGGRGATTVIAALGFVLQSAGALGSLLWAAWSVVAGGVANG